MGRVESFRELDRSLTPVALALFAPGSVQQTLQQIVDVALMTVGGCDATGVLLVENEQVITLACSDPVVIELDGLQFETGEGPGLDAVSQDSTFYVEDLAVDGRWPRFGPVAATNGIRSVLSFPLAGERASVLNLYASHPAAFGATDRAKGLSFATLAGIALDAAMRRADDETRATQLLQGLKTRELIGQAQGILMERERITGDQAFQVLRRASQHLNIKLLEVAQRLVETGETPQTEPGPPR